MSAPKEDRRSRRTRHLLGNALVELMYEKRFDDITVQDILDRADVGRSTFYAHYTGKEHLLMSEIERVLHLLGNFAAESAPHDPELLPSLAFFRHVQEHRRLLQAFIWGRGADMLTQQLQAQLSRIAEDNLRALIGDGPEPAVPLPITARFVATTFLMLLRWWFDHEMRQTPEQMEAMFRALVMPAIRPMLPPANDRTPGGDALLP